MIKENQECLSKYYDDFYKQNIHEDNFFEHELYNDIIEYLYQALEKTRFYFKDGRLEDSFLNVLKMYKDLNESEVNFSEFSQFLEEEVKKHTSEYVLIVSLNGLKKNGVNPEVEFSDKRFRLFSVTETKNKILKNRTSIARYLKSRLDFNLNSRHMIYKDHNFFKNPVLTIILSNTTDTIVYKKAPYITLIIYTFLRMYDFVNYQSSGNWEETSRIYLTRTYAVYYSGIDKFFNKKREYGHQMKYLISPILDVNSDLIYSDFEEAFKPIYKYIDLFFTPENEVDIKTYKAYNRFFKATELLNTAFELSSVEKYDEAQILLLTLLESLFIKNSGRAKSTRVCEQITAYIDESSGDIIEKIYKRRNSFVHEGCSLPKIYSYKLAEVEHNYYMGHRPFSVYSMFGYPEEINDLKQLLLLCIKVLYKMIEDENYIIGEHQKK
jgi:hypothetical protein